MGRFVRGAAALILGTTLTARSPRPKRARRRPNADRQRRPRRRRWSRQSRHRAKPEVRPTGNAATVNGQPIPEVAVYRALRQFPPDQQEMARKEIMAHLIENILIDQYLNAIKVTVEEKEVDALINELKAELIMAKKDYVKELEAMMLTEAEFRTEVTAQLKWEKFVKQQGDRRRPQATVRRQPGCLRRHDGPRPAHPDDARAPTRPSRRKRPASSAASSRSSSRRRRRPSPRCRATADALQKEQAKAAKTEELFAAYAKEYSTCPSKKDGGDLNFFPRAGAMVEPFAKAAFALKPFEMTDVVATEFGYHLILVTARKQGTPKKFEEVKEDVRMLYAMRLREAVIAQMKPKAQITITRPPTRRLATPPIDAPKN